MKLRNGALATGAVAMLAAFGLLAGVAGAQNTTPTQQPAKADAPHPIQLGGKVASVNAAANSLTVTSPKGTFNITTSDKTWVLAQKDGKCAEGSLSDLKADQVVMVGGMTTTTPNQVNARTVVQGACFADKAGNVPARKGPVGNNGNMGKGGKIGAVANHVAMGAIKAIAGNTITITSERGDEVTINTTASTVVLNGGFKDASTLKVGDKIQVLGKPAAKPEKPANPPAEKPAQKPARTIEAWGVHVVADNSKLVVGHVEKVEGNTITLKTRHDSGVESATLDSNTGYRAANVMDRTVALTNAVQSDVKAGSNVLIEGVASADGKSIAARSVVLLPAGPAKGNKTKP